MVATRCARGTPQRPRNNRGTPRRLLSPLAYHARLTTLSPPPVSAPRLQSTSNTSPVSALLGIAPLLKRTGMTVTYSSWTEVDPEVLARNGDLSHVLHFNEMLTSAVLMTPTPANELLVLNRIPTGEVHSGRRPFENYIKTAIRFLPSRGGTRRADPKFNIRVDKVRSAPSRPPFGCTLLLTVIARKGETTTTPPLSLSLARAFCDTASLSRARARDGPLLR